MQHHRDALVALALGFALTSAAMLPPIIADHTERSARIAAFEQTIGTEGVTFGRERTGRLAHLIRNPEASRSAGVAYAERARLSHKER